ncbi:hypothetical protein CV102_01430 [Natronococcus pandeyae]|uniref:Halobacterial output domain-containing protein n=1 Tax=Natronococcus pandeyae TaxID=2055836 RepID=A0A8J8TTU2_9EURY|nr:HalOD1 output domain-containing protein [Natronococcus pandeyae]TYL40269.1 hypothetical protein CV102_01430 [Natronococcus pandeyae]
MSKEHPYSTAETAREERSTAVTSRHDWHTDESLAVDVVTAVATAVDSAPTELESLYATIDPDALETVLRSDRNDEQLSERRRVSFEYAGRVVTVRSDGVITVSTRGRTRGEGDE